jgi:putative mycofactocin binding protein MftB
VSLSTTRQFDPSVPWCVNPQVSLRDEAFGALAYHHGTRRLVFLKSRELVDLVRCLDDSPSADVALQKVVPTEQRDRYVAALSSLASSEIIGER